MAQNIPLHTMVRIFSEEGSRSWAKSFPVVSIPPPFLSRIIFDNNYAHIFENWDIRPFEEGYTIQNRGTRFYAYDKDGHVYTSDEFDPAHCKWYIETAGGNTYKIKVPNQDSVWTVKRYEPNHPLSLYLAPADGGDNQRYSFGPTPRVAEE